MANIGELTYNVTLDTKQFNQTVKSMQDTLSGLEAKIGKFSVGDGSKAKSDIEKSLNDLEAVITKLTVSKSVNLEELRKVLDDITVNVSKVSFAGIDKAQLQNELNSLFSNISANVNVSAKSVSGTTGGSSSSSSKEESYVDKLQAKYESVSLTIEKLNQQKAAFENQGLNTTAIDTTISRLSILQSAMERAMVSDSSAKTFLKNQGAGSDAEIKNYEKLLDVITKVKGEISNIEGMQAKGTAGANAEAIKKEYQDLLDALNKAAGSISSNDATTFLGGINRAIADIQQRAKLGFITDAQAQKDQANAIKVQEQIEKIKGTLAKFDEIKATSQSLGLDTSAIDAAIEKMSKFQDSLSSGSTASGIEKLNGEFKITKAECGNLVAEQKRLEAAAKKAGASGGKEYQSFESTMAKVAAKQEEVNLLMQVANAKKLDTSHYERALQVLTELTNRLNSLTSTGKDKDKEAFGVSAEALKRVQNMITAQKQLNAETEKMRNGASAEKTFADAVRQSNAELSKKSSLLQQLKPLVADAFSIYAVKQFLDAIIDVGGEIQKQRMAMSSILGDEGFADSLYGQMRQLAVKSPFGIMDLLKNVKQLSAFGVEANELYETMKRLSDISAGVGVDVGRLAYAFGQVKSRTWLDAKELRQISYTGIPMLAKLTDYWNASKAATEEEQVTTAEMRKMISERKVSFDDMKAVLWQMTDEGGMFYNMQEVMSESVAAKYKNMHDAIDLLMGDLAESNSEILKAPAEAITALVRNYDELVPLILAVVAAWGAQKATLMVNNALLGTNTGKVIQSVLAYKQQQAAQLVAMSGYKKLSTSQRNLINTSNTLTGAELKSMAAAGMLNKEQLLGLVATKKVTVEDARLAASLLGVDAAELKAAASASKFKVAMMMAGNAIRSFGTALKALFLNPTTWVFMLIGGIAELYQRATDFSRDMQNIADQNAKAAQTMAQNIDNSMPEFDDIAKSLNGNPNSISDGVLKESIEQLVDLIKEYDPEWGYTLLQSLTPDKQLSEQWKELYDRIVAIKGTASLEDLNGIATDANEATNGYFDDSVTENLKDYQDALHDTDMCIAELGKHYGIVTDAIKQAKGVDSAYSKALEGKNLSLKEQLRLLEGYPTAMNKVTKVMSDAENEIGKSYNNFLSSLAVERLVLNDDLLPDMNQFVEAVKGILVSKGYTNLKDLPAEVKLKLAMDTKGMLDSIDGLNDEMKKLFYQETLEKYFNIHMNTIFDNNGDDLSGWQKVLNDATGGEFKNAIKQAHNMQEAVESIQKAYKEAKETIGQMKPILLKFGISLNGQEIDFNNVKSGIPLFDQEAVKNAIETANGANKTINAAVAGHNSLGYLLEDPTKNKGRGSQKDTFLDNLKKRMKAIQDAYNEYKKWKDLVGDEEANKTLKNSGIFKAIFGTNNIKVSTEDFKKQIADITKQLEGKATTTARKSFLQELISKTLNLQYDDTKKQLEKFVALNKEAIDKMSKQWDVYNSWYSVTGNQKLATQMMQNSAQPIWTEEALAFKKAFEDAGGSTTANFSMSDYEAKEMYKETPELYDLWKKIHDLITDAGFSFSNDMAKLYADTLDYNDKLQAIESKYKEMREKNTSNDPNVSKGIDLAEKNEKASLNFEEFQRTSGWERIFGNLNNMSLATMQKMREEIEKYSDEYKNLPIDQVKAFEEALEKLNTAEINRNPILGMQNALDARSKANNIMVGRFAGFDENGKPIYAGSIKGYDKNGKPVYYTQADKDDALATADEDMNKAVTSLIQKFNALASGLDLVSDMFDALGNEDISSVLSNVTGVIGAATSGASTGMNAANAIDPSLGPYGAALGAALSVTTKIAQIHDAALQKEIEASKLRVQALENASDQLETLLERTMGGIYNLTVDENSATKIQEIVDDATSAENTANALNNAYLENYAKIFGEHAADSMAKNLPYTADQFRKYSDETVNKAKEAQESGSYYDYQLANLMAQRDEVQAQLADEQDKKKTDKSAVEDYKNQLAELKDQIDNFAEDMAETLYSIDFKDWASQLSDALVSAWSNGENAANAYKNTVSELLRSVATSMIQQKYLETMLDPLMDEFLEQFEADNGEITGASESILAKMVQTANSAVDASYSALDGFEEYANENGYSLKETASSNLGNSVSSVTEETADLLGSYINGMRADLSIQRMTVEQMAMILQDPVFGMEQTNAIQRSQLMQLQQIVTNTSISAEKATRIESLLQSVVDGTETLHIA